MKKLMLLFALGTMFVLGSCGTKSTTVEETDVVVVDEVVDSTTVSNDELVSTDTVVVVLED